MATQGNTGLHEEVKLPQRNLLVAVIRTAWNSDITTRLQDGCTGILQKHGVRYETYVVPGAVELTYAAKCLAHGAYDAVVVLGCVIQGDTPHFDYVCQSVTQGITLLNATGEIPVIFGVLTVHNEQQALDRVGGLHGHKGEEAAFSALHMIAFRYRNA